MTPAARLGTVEVSGSRASVSVSCAGSANASCTITLVLTVSETIHAGRVIAVTAASRRQTKTTRRTVVLGTTRMTLASGQSRTVALALHAAGKRLLVARRRLPVRMAVASDGHSTGARTLNFKQPAGHN